MSKSGQQHSKADVGGQRTKTEKPSDGKPSSTTPQKSPAQPPQTGSKKG